MKTEIADKKLEILNWIFKSKDGASWNEVSEMLNEFEKVCKDEAIAEHEASQWKKYPENKPDKSGWYWVHHKDGYESRVHSEENWELFVESKKVIAFRELPKPYQEERQSFGNPNGCHNCKHQDNDDVCKKCDETWDKWEGGER